MLLFELDSVVSEVIEQAESEQAPALHTSKEAGHFAKSVGTPLPTSSAEAGVSSLSSINSGAVQGDGIPIHYSTKFLAVVHNHKMHRDRTREYC
jgi:hypothetical protein